VFRVLTRQVLIDLRERRLQTFQLFLILAAATAILTLTISFRRTAQILWNRFVSETNGAQVTFISRNAMVDLAPVTTLEPVAESSGPFPTLVGRILAQDPEKHNITIIGYPSELPAVDRPLLVAGRWLDPQGRNEIVLDPSFAQEIGILVGEQVDMLTPSGKVELSVVGLAVSPTWPYPLRATVPGYVLGSTLSAIEPQRENWVSILGVRLTSPAEVDSFMVEAQSLLPEGSINVTWQLEESRDKVQFWDSFSVALLGVFSVFTLLAVALIIAYATIAIVLAQYREIGLLKAIGFTPAQVAFLLLLENLAIGLLAGIIGVFVGAALAPVLQSAELLRRYQGLLEANPLFSLDPALALIVLGGVEVIVLLATLLPAWRGGQVNTLRAITVGFAQVNNNPVRLIPISWGGKLSPVVKLGFKSAFARPARALLALGGLVLTFSILTLTLVVETSRQGIIEKPEQIGYPYDFIVERNYLTDSDAQEILKGHSEISDYTTLAYTRLRFAGTPLAIDVVAVGGAYDRFDFRILEGNMFSQVGEVIVGPKLLEEAGLRIGDEFRLETMDGNPFPLRIVGSYVDVDSRGYAVAFSLDTLQERVGGTVTPAEYGVKLASGSDVDAIRASLLEDSRGIFGLEVWRLPEQLAEARSPLIGLAVALVLIALVNLFNATQLDVRERFHDFGVLKSVGLTPWQVWSSVIIGMALLTLIALLISIPLGLLVTRAVLDYLGGLLGYFASFPIVVRWDWLALLIPGAILMALLGSALPAWRAARMSVVEALRYE